MTKVQNNKQLTLLYIDDSPDPWLSKYLANYAVEDHDFLKRSKYSLVYKEYQFDSSIDPNDFLHQTEVCQADVYIIDSRLFENRTELEKHKRYKGEELELLLRKLRPFTEVIIVSQKSILSNQDIVAKYSVKSDADFNNCKTFYDRELKLDDKILSVIGTQSALREFVSNEVWSSSLRKRMQESADFVPNYDELTPADIDKLVEAFQKIERKLDDK